MHKSLISYSFLLFAICLLSACANIIPPTGGKNDSTPPKLLSIKPQDSLLNTRVTRIDMKFDEFVTVNDVAKELTISPILTQSPLMTVSGKTVSLKIPDSLLQENTTYTINFGNAIRDLHEGNAYKGKTFLFSTGPWFDSLHLKGKIIDAALGKADSSGTVKILLYDSKLPYDIVTRQKPSYVTTSNTKGEFVVNGLPDRRFRIFALKESGDNLKFDNDDESIAFADTTFNPQTDTLPVSLSLFKEIPDTSKKKSDTSIATVAGIKRKARFSGPQTNDAAPAVTLDAKTFNYVAIIDTSNVDKRTQDITKPVELLFSRKLDTFDIQRMVLTYDSSGIEIENKINGSMDTSRKKIILATLWKENTLYTLRLLKGFATDTSKDIVMPSRYIFRSKSEDDYGKMEISIPEKYLGKNYLLQVTRDAETVYLDSVSAAKVSLKRLAPGMYKIVLIEDTNGDGEWTTGELKSRRHAEEVIPYHSLINMKAAWEHIVNFETEKKVLQDKMPLNK